MDHVIDTNYLRKPELETRLQPSAAGDRFILTDTAVLETLKNAQWEFTARKSFEIIARYPNKIWIAKAPADLRREELSTGVDTRDVIDAALSAGFRELLAELASGSDGPNLVSLRAKIVSAQSDLAKQQQNHAANFNGLKSFVDDIRNKLDVKGYRKTVDLVQKDKVRLFLIKTLAQVCLKKVIELEGGSATVGDALANGRGISIRYQIGLYCLGFKWAMKGTISPDPAKATNEMMDLSHALIATYFDDILSEEASVREMRKDILDVLDSNVSAAEVMPPPT